MPQRIPTHRQRTAPARATAAQRGYNAAWQRRRKEQLAKEPCCEKCLKEGRVELATVADHIVAHKGDPVLFAGPLQSLCKRHHDEKTVREDGGFGRSPRGMGAR